MWWRLPQCVNCVSHEMQITTWFRLPLSVKINCSPSSPKRAIHFWSSSRVNPTVVIHSTTIRRASSHSLSSCSDALYLRSLARSLLCVRARTCVLLSVNPSSHCFSPACLLPGLLDYSCNRISNAVIPHTHTHTHTKIRKSTAMLSAPQPFRTWIVCLSDITVY